MSSWMRLINANYSQFDRNHYKLLCMDEGFDGMSAPDVKAFALVKWPVNLSLDDICASAVSSSLPVNRSWGKLIVKFVLNEYLC